MAALPLWRRAANLFISTLRWVFHTFVAVVTALIALLFLFSAFSDWFSPSFSITAAYLGLFFPFFALLLVGWILFLAIARRWKYLLVAAVVLLLASERLWRYCPLNLFAESPVTEIAAADGTMRPVAVDTIRVMTYNTRAMGDVRLTDSKSKMPVLDVVRQSGADIVCLQEFAFTDNPKGYTEERIRNILKADYPYYAFIKNTKRKSMGVALFSKHPITKCERIDLEKSHYSAMAYAEINYKGRTLSVINAYMQSFRIPVKEREFMNEMGKHFNADSIARLERGIRDLGESFRIRAEQGLCARNYLASLKLPDTRPVLVMGDMNDTPVSFTYNKMRGGMADTWQDVGCGLGVTFRDFPFWFRIDHIFHNACLRALDIKTDKTIRYSDHYPVVATFQLLPDEP